MPSTSFTIASMDPSIIGAVWLGAACQRFGTQTLKAPHGSARRGVGVGSLDQRGASAAMMCDLEAG